MLSTSSMIIFGVIALIAVVVIWKWWKKPNLYKKNDELIQDTKEQDIKNQDIGKGEGQGQGQEQKQEQKQKQEESIDLTQIPLTVFAINDNGILDLADMSGKALNIGFGRHPKTYAILLNYAENDTDKVEQGNTITFISKVGNTKTYDVIQQPYIINYTRL
jgi:hypothetical protein